MGGHRRRRVNPRELVTARLVLTPLTLAHAGAVLSGTRGADWSPGYPTTGDRVVAGLLVAGHGAGEPDQPGPWGPWLLRLRGVDLVVGGAGFHGPPQHGTVEIGYGIAAEHRRLGLAREAVAALLRLAAVEGVVRVVAHVDVGNEPSARLLAALGFTAVPGSGDPRDPIAPAPGQLRWEWRA